LVFAAVGAMFYAWLLYQRGSPFAAGSDSSGYLNSARLLARGEFAIPVRAVEGLTPADYDFIVFQPLGFVINRVKGTIAPTYPIGLPLHLLAAAPVVGWEKTARVVNVLNALAAGALLYALGRRLGLGRAWALGGVALLWASPVFLYHAIQPMSDPLAVTWVLAALLAAWRARDDARWGLGAGAAFAMAVLVRPTNLLLALPLAIALGLRWRAWLACVAAGLPGAIALGYYNERAYESPFTSGYGYLGDAFELRFLGPTLAHFALWIPLLVSVPAALAALALPWTERRRPALVAMLAAWLLVLVAFYCTYFCAHETWWYLRFLLPAFPAVILAGALAGQSLAARLRGAARSLVPLACFAAGLAQLGAITAREGFLPELRNWERDYALGARWLDAHLPPGAVVVCAQTSGALFYYTGFVIARSDFLSPRDFHRLAQAAARAGRPIYAAFLPEEPGDVFEKRLGGEWRRIGTDGKLLVWQLVRAPAAPPPEKTP
jgi:4-amino-4-deoxy-L-arabinose transferase-like glycosyltransferase